MSTASAADPLDPQDDPRVLAAAREYLSQLEAGVRPDRARFVHRHPELAAALSECFDGIDLAHALRPAAPPPLLPHPQDPLIQQLGDFQILSEIGRGGMGVVYEAMQLSLRRRVALKVLPFAASLDPKYLVRFQTEAHAAAQLHHSNIVPVYAVGQERGVHFYAMQLIEGRSLDAVIRERRGDPLTKSGVDVFASTVELFTDPTTERTAPGKATSRTSHNRESFRTIARIAAQVADGLAYAHDAGVVHRDIKPANLMLDARGTVWITDFGLAHVSADVGLTQTGDMVGTLRYMSPEQAAGQRVLVDHRADVYSLGATLYEILALEPIFAGPTRHELLHQILNQEPRPLRQLDRTIPVELETIVLKAVSKSPTDRYATAGEMAADLRRFLDEQPILARRPSVFEHVRKWVRRHPSVIWASLIPLVCGVIGLGITTAIVTREQALTQAAYDRERKRAEEAEERFQLARRAADDMIQIAEEEMVDNPELDALRKLVLETALAYYQEFLRQRSENAADQAELAATRDRVTKILSDLAVMQEGKQFFLLRDAAVLDDLQLDATQRMQIKEIERQHDVRREAMFRDLANSNLNERRQQFVDRLKADEAALNALLTKGQIVRLRQLGLQVQGPFAFRQPDVAQALKLTSEQRDRIRLVLLETYGARHDRRSGPPPDGSPHDGPPPHDRPPPHDGPRPGPMGEGGPSIFEPFGLHLPPPDNGPPPDRPPLRVGGPPPGGPGRAGEHEERTQSALRKIEDILTDAQWSTWKTMVGPPFTGTFREYFPGRGPPPFGRPR